MILFTGGKRVRAVGELSVILQDAAAFGDLMWSPDRRNGSYCNVYSLCGEWRHVPIPPPLTRILRAHLDQFGTGRDGRVFSGIHGGELASITYRRTWDKSRSAALAPAEYVSPLARRVYDLRHACVSTWLNGGVPPAQVAEWAGHSVAVQPPPAVNSRSQPENQKRHLAAFVQVRHRFMQVRTGEVFTFRADLGKQGPGGGLPTG